LGAKRGGAIVLESLYAVRWGYAQSRKGSYVGVGENHVGGKAGWRSGGIQGADCREVVGAGAIELQPALEPLAPV
jgi:hypothetical protein